jgi:hypothetical protein
MFPYIFAIAFKKRAISSVGLEHLPYKQGVVGSNPSSPTKQKGVVIIIITPFFIILKGIA